MGSYPAGSAAPHICYKCTVSSYCKSTAMWPQEDSSVCSFIHYCVLRIQHARVLCIQGFRLCIQQGRVFRAAEFLDLWGQLPCDVPGNLSHFHVVIDCVGCPDFYWRRLVGPFETQYTHCMPTQSCSVRDSNTRCPHSLFCYANHAV